MVDELYRLFKREVLAKLAEVHVETDRYLYFISWLNAELERRGLGRIIVTGGFAVEVYTGRVHRTMDVDVIAEGAQAARVVEEFLAKFSERIGRGYLPRYEVLQLKSLDLVSTVYDKNLPPVKLLVGEYYVYLVPVEELVVAYLAGWKYWNATEDRDKALWLYAVWRERVNIEYLKNRAKEERVEDYLEKLEEIALALRKATEERR